MGWLRFNDGDKKVVVLVDGVVKERRRHWVDRRSHDCAGDECPLCEMGYQPKVAWVTRVRVGDVEYTWEMTAGAWRQLEELLPGQEARKGAAVVVERRGRGMDTRYYLSLPDAAGQRRDDGGQKGRMTWRQVQELLRRELQSDAFRQQLYEVVRLALEDFFATPPEQSSESKTTSASDFVEEFIDDENLVW